MLHFFRSQHSETQFRGSAVGLALIALAGIPAMASAKDGLANVDNELCWQGSNKNFTVKECIVDFVTKPTTGGMPALPDSMVQLVQSELMWSPSLLDAVLNHGSVRGDFTRTATLDGVVTDLGTHSFRTRLDGNEKRAQFSIQLSGHAIQELRVDYSADGSGNLTAVGEHERAVQFEAGLAVLDSTDHGGATKSSFYMGCYIDTPAYDLFRKDACFRLGDVPSVAVFKFFLPYTPESYVWYNPAGCSGQWCTAPISPGQTISAGGYWVINGIPTGPRGATATYYYEPGGPGGGRF